MWVFLRSVFTLLQELHIGITGGKKTRFLKILQFLSDLLWSRNILCCHKCEFSKNIMLKTENKRALCWIIILYWYYFYVTSCDMKGFILQWYTLRWLLFECVMEHKNSIIEIDFVQVLWILIMSLYSVTKNLANVFVS